MQKNSALIWIIVVLIGIAALYKFKHSSISQTRQASPESVNHPVPSAAPPKATVPTPMATTEPSPPTINENDAFDPDSEEQNDATNYEFQMYSNPICGSKSDNLINLPSLFLRQFYSESKTWILLPKAYAECLKAGTHFEAMFYDFDPSHEYPFRPLVKMDGFVDSIKEYLTLSDAQLQNTKNPYLLKLGKKASPDIFAAVQSLFASKTTSPWVQIFISKNNIENKPSFWPDLPTIHPVAQIISKASLPKGENWASNYIILDTRHIKVKKKYKLPFKPQLRWYSRYAADSRTILSINKLEPQKNKSLFKKDKNSPILIIGKNAADLTAYNAANFLTLAGYKSISIVREGAEGWGVGETKSIQIPAPKISEDGLKELKKKEKDKLAIIDCRSSNEVEHGTIPGAISIPVKRHIEEVHSPETEKVATKEKSTEEENDEEAGGDDLDLSEIESLLKTNKIQSTIFYSHSPNDLKANKRALKIIQKLNPPRPLQLEDGFEGWQFFSLYKWTPEKTAAKKPKDQLARKKDPRKNPPLRFNKTSYQQQADTAKEKAAKAKERENKPDNEKAQNAKNSSDQDVQNNSPSQDKHEKGKRKRNKRNSD